MSHVAPERQYTTKQRGPQEPFLVTESNKKIFIALLMEQLQENGFKIDQAQGDSDTMIVSVALSCVSSSNVPVVVRRRIQTYLFYCCTIGVIL